MESAQDTTKQIQKCDNLKYKIAIIQPNECKISKENINDIGQIIGDHVEIIEVTHDKLPEIITNTIGMIPEKVMGDTSTVYQNDKYVYDMCFVDPEQNKTDPDESKYNEIATHLIIDNQKVYGNVVIMRSRITDDKICEPDEFTYDHLLELLRSKTVHIGLFIPTKGNISEYQFYKDPVENLEVAKMQKLGYVESTISKFNLLAFFPIDDNVYEINKRVTRLLNRKVYGDVYLISRSTEATYEDLTYELYDKLDSISWGHTSERNLTTAETEESEKDGLPIISNRYTILETRMQTNYRKCSNCAITKIDKVSVCTGCYRVLYCTKKCQMQNWIEHRKDCLYKLESVNKSVQQKKQDMDANMAMNKQVNEQIDEQVDEEVDNEVNNEVNKEKIEIE